MKKPKAKRVAKRPKQNKRLKNAILKKADKEGHGELLRSMIKSGRLVIG